MERLEIIKKAQQLACEEIDDVAALGDDEFADLQELYKYDEEAAVAELARRFLDEATENAHTK